MCAEARQLGTDEGCSLAGTPVRRLGEKSLDPRVITERKRVLELFVKALDLLAQLDDGAWASA